MTTKSGQITTQTSRKIKGRKRITEFEIYARFLALTDVDKVKVFGFKTDTDFCKKYKLSNQTLSDWKMDQQLWSLRDKFLGQFKRLTANVLASLYNGILEKQNASEILLWFKVVEGYNDREQSAPIVPIQININDDRENYK